MALQRKISRQKRRAAVKNSIGSAEIITIYRACLVYRASLSDLADSDDNINSELDSLAKIIDFWESQIPDDVTTRIQSDLFGDSDSDDSDVEKSGLEEGLQ